MYIVVVLFQFKVRAPLMENPLSLVFIFISIHFYYCVFVIVIFTDFKETDHSHSFWSRVELNMKYVYSPLIRKQPCEQNYNIVCKTEHKS